MTRPVEDRQKIAGRLYDAWERGHYQTMAEGLYGALSAGFAAIYPGRQKKSVKEWRAIRAKGFNAACRALRRKR